MGGSGILGDNESGLEDFVSWPANSPADNVYTVLC